MHETVTLLRQPADVGLSCARLKPFLYWFACKYWRFSFQFLGDFWFKTW